MEIKKSLKLNDVEVFITDVKNNIQVEQSLKKLEKVFPKLKINLDLNESELPYPCGHTVLRVKGKGVSFDKIRSTIRHLGFNCDVLEDKICN